MTSASGSDYWKGLLAGLIATAALSALMMLKARMGVLPQLDVIRMLGEMVGNGSRTVGWLAHFLIGTVAWGLLYVAMFGAADRGHWWRGIVFAVGAWLVMMIAVMPMAGAGFFGWDLGALAPVATLMLHLIYGIVLGATYGALSRREPLPLIAHR